MEREPDHVPCEATICKHYESFIKGCVFTKIKIDSKGKCKSFVRSKPYPRIKK